MSYSCHGHIAQQHAISYSRVHEILLGSLKHVLPDISGYGTHSFKSGAATAAVNSGVATSQQLDSHAGWKCAGSKHFYVELDLNSKLAVSKFFVCHVN